MKNYFLFILGLFTLSNCEKVDCNKSADYYRKMDMNFILIKKKPLNHGREVNFKIKNNQNNKDENYCDENTWFAWHYADFEEGDTIIKKKGETVFSIHKKDTVLSFIYECNGKIYK
ncbi:MAG: hypothetical protein EAY77_07770 [Flavobacteriia bacterium]|jgi:hypothetical protein|nr:MAG: hypothetical protein EAY77_07770 [Flavobacteriia bacterium]